MKTARAALWRGAALALALAGVDAPVAVGKENLRITGTAYGDQTGPYLERMAEEFHSASPDIDIKVEMVAGDALLGRLNGATPDDPVPDIAIIGSRWLPELVKEGRAEPLDGMMSGEFRSRFIRPLLGPGQVGGKTYGLPFAASADALYYNTDLLAKAGIAAPPESWDEVRADGGKLKAAGIAGFGIQGRGDGTDIGWYEALWSEGGELRGPDGKAAFASPAGVAALTLYKTMMDEGLTEAEPANCSREELRTLFRQGRLAMLIADQFLISEIAAQAPGLTYGVAPPPKGTRQATYAVTDSAVLFKTSKSKAAAWKFLDFLFTKQPRLEFTSTEGFLPTTKAVAADRFIAKNERLRTFVKLLSDARFTPAVAGWDDAAREVAEAVRWVYLDKTQPAAALTAAAARVDDILAK